MSGKRALFHVLLVTVILFMICNDRCSALEKDSRSQFFYHEVVQPDIQAAAREKRDIKSTKVQSEELLTVTFTAFKKKFILDLWMNSLLLPSHYFEKHYENGNQVIYSPMKDDAFHCHYQGRIRGVNSSLVAVSTCRGLSGIINNKTETYYIQPDTASGDNSHFLFRAKDLKPQNLSCGVSDSSKFLSKSHPMNLFKRIRRSATVHEPYKSNPMSLYVELVIVNDNREFKTFNEDKVAVFERSKEIANIVNGLYAPLNIFVALVGVVIWSDTDEINVSTDGEFTLTNFLHYRREKLFQQYSNDNAQLITSLPFDGAVVSKALKGTICTQEFSGGVVSDYSPVVGLIATNVAHSLGHNFGMEHDSVECQCPDDGCIMAPTFGFTSPHQWSSCSLESLDLAFSHGMNYCLKNRPFNVTSPVCGNGFLEEGEGCDCGLKEFCDSHCCNSTSCQLFSNATCGTGACCDLDTCQVKQVTTVCRSDVSECDLPEHCDGVSEFCPPDAFHQNGKECGNGKAYCYDGNCESHSDHCKVLWGESGNMSDLRCFEQNVKGNRNGNCGSNLLNKTYKACREEDILCGMLHCTHSNDRLEFGLESAAIFSRSFINVKGTLLTCRSAIVDLGSSNTGPGMVPNGAKCGDGKACVNQRCISVGSILNEECLNNCNRDRIVYDDEGNCHCKIDNGASSYITAGPDGSIYSDPELHQNRLEELVGNFLLFLSKITWPYF